MDVFEAIGSRRSVRKYEAREVEEENLGKVLEAGRSAPTAKNLQPFRFWAIKTADHVPAIQKLYRGAWLLEAPFVLAVASNPATAWKRSFDGKNSSDIDAAIAMDHMVLAATALGLGTCWICAFDPTAARELLNLEPGWEPIAFTPLGYPAERPEPRLRKLMEELLIRL
jgi:nitroreductase